MMKMSSRSRLKRGELVIVPKADTDVELGDILHLVGNPEGLKKMHLIIGEEVDVPVASLSGEIRSERVVVTNEKVLGKQIRHLGIHQKYGVVISRLNRAGVELVPTAHTTLQFGDVLHMVGKTDILNQAISVIGNAKQKLLQVQMLPVFIGIGLEGITRLHSFLYSRLPCGIEIRASGRAVSRRVDLGSNWLYRQTLLVYAAECELGIARNWYCALPRCSRFKIWR